MRLENLRPFIIPLLLTQLAFAQTPTIGGIELFGAPAAIIEKVRQSLEIKIGDPIPKSKVELEDQIATAGNIARASVTAICCVESKAILYIGIQEKEGEGFELREEPTGTAELPPKIVEAFTDFMNSLTGIAASVAGSANSLVMESACLAPKCAATLASNFFTSNGMPSARRLRWPIG